MWNFQKHGERPAVIEALRAFVSEHSAHPADQAQAARATAFAIGELERSTREFATVQMGGAASGGDHHVSITIDHPGDAWSIKRTTRKARLRRDPANGERRPTETRETLARELAPTAGRRAVRHQPQLRAFDYIASELGASGYLHASVSARGDDGSGGITISVSSAE